MAMDQELAALYGTPGAATAEDQEKVASVELFTKLAAQEGINLNNLDDDQLGELWDHTFSKQAEDAPAEEDEQAKVAAAAQAEFDSSQEWSEKVAECDKLGRIMAHSYVQELNKIAADQEGTDGEGKKCPDCGKEDCTCPAADKGNDKGDDKEASAIDQLAGRHAVELAKEAGFDEAMAIERISSVMTLGLCAPSEKTASAESVEETIHIRALEHLETAGFPVTWGE